MAQSDIVELVDRENHVAVISDDGSKSDMKTSEDGIILIPQPSSDRSDPLVKHFLTQDVLMNITS